MYETVMKRKPTGFVVVNLSEDELTTLKQMVLGYGNTKRVAEEAKMPVPTLRDLLLRGRGKPATIKKIRRVMNQRRAA